MTEKIETKKSIMRDERNHEFYSAKYFNPVECTIDKNEKNHVLKKHRSSYKTLNAIFKGDF
jgi:hypothetical protein